MHLMVGDELEAEVERPFQKDITSRFEWFVGDQVLSLVESQPDGATPVFRRAVEGAGVSLLVMDRDFVTIETTVEQFLQFLDHESQSELGSIYADADPSTPLTRRYARSIKALVKAGDAMDGGLHEKTVGQQTEICLLDQPHALSIGEEFRVNVAFEGRDLEGQLIRAMVRESDGTTAIQNATTDGAGTAGFTLDRPGLWLVRVAYLERCEEDCEADWDTHYAVLSFVRE